MHNKHLFRLCVKCINPTKKPIFISMTTWTLKLYNLCLYLYRFAKKFNLLCTINYYTACCSNSLITDKYNCTLWSPQIMLQVMSYSSRFTHTWWRNNNLRIRIKVNLLWFITRSCILKSWKWKRINPLSYKFYCIIIKAALHILNKYVRRFNSKWTIHIYIKISANEIIFFNLSYDIKQFLSSSYCKGRNNNITASFKCSLKYIS